MLTALNPVRVGPMTLPAPTSEPHEFSGRHGQMWQWLGDGRELISLSLAVRRTRLGTEAGVRDHLNWEVDRLRKQLDDDAESQVHRIDVHVVGALASAGADVDGTQRSVEVRNRLVVATDGEWMHVVQVMVRDHPSGRELAAEVASGLSAEPWSMPS